MNKNKSKIGFVFLVVCCLCFVMFEKSSFASEAMKLTDKDVYAWLEKYKDAKPEFKVGDVITYDKRKLLEPFVPPALQTLHLFEGMKIQIGGLQDTDDFSPHACYKEATKKFYGQPKLGPKGELLNYTAGQPFPEELMKNDDPMTKGMKIGYNSMWRWGNRDEEAWHRPEYMALGGGLGFDEGLFTFTTIGQHKGNYYGYPAAWFPGGDFQRVMKWTYSKTWYRGRADLAESNYKVPSPDAEKVDWKEIIAFYDPYDVKGTTELTIRYADPFKKDDAWVYVPAARRVRRVATGQRADSLLGSEFTLDDFFGFSGKQLEWDWKCLGKKSVLCWLDEINQPDEGKFGGPGGGACVERNAKIRECWVVEMKAKYSSNYSKKIIFYDTQTMAAVAFVAFDQAEKLWKTYQIGAAWSENPFWKGTYHYGRRIVDVGNGHCCIYNHQTDKGAGAVCFTLHAVPPRPGKVLDELYSVDNMRQYGK